MKWFENFKSIPLFWNSYQYLHKMVKCVIRDVSKYHSEGGTFMRINLIELNVFEKMLTVLLRRYTYKIYRKGIIDGFNGKSWYSYWYNV